MGPAASRPLVTERQKVGEKIEFPEKVYVLITTHGRMNFTLPSSDENTQELGRLTVYTVPDGITVKKISAAIPGLCNYISPGYEKEILDYMKQTIDSEFIPGDTLTQHIEFTTKSGKRMFIEEETPEERILNFLKSTDPSVKDLRKILKSGDTNDVTDIRNYLQSPRYFLNTYKSGARIPNKYFSYSSNDTDDSVPSIIKEIGRNNKIFDVMKAIKKEITKTKSNGEQIITTYTTENDIIQFFKTHGVKEVVLLDLSCSVFNSPQGESPTPRTARLVRKSIVKQQNAGKRKTKTKTKTIYKKKSITLKKK